jgi:hypothetical protein
VRTELKKKTGIVVNEYGQRIIEDTDENGNKVTISAPSDPNDYILNREDPNQKDKPQKKEYTPIKSYKPSGNLIYDNDLLDKMENRFR